MSTSEILIYLSSDDEFESQRDIDAKNVEYEKSQSKKRPATQVADAGVTKRIALLPAHEKPAPVDNVLEIVEELNLKNESEITKNETQDVRVPANYQIMHRSSSQSTISETLSKPQLIVKEKRSVELTSGSQEVFAMFLSQCLQRDRSESMKKVVAKLKRHYEQLDPLYSQSTSFIKLLNEKREFLVKDDSYPYTHISDVDTEMKNQKIGKKKDLNAPSTSRNKEKVYGESGDKKLERKIRKISNAMKECEKRIKKLEETEIDFEDENNSSYIKLERYKAQITKLNHKYCELIGEHVDAGRAFLRPKHLQVTKIPSVDRAIYSFINKSPQTKIGKKIATAGCLIFPDYNDILSCIHACNVEQELGMNSKKESAIAERAFKDLGDKLKRMRQKDFFDTFSLMYEKDDDPAIEDHELADKLQHNRQLGEENMKKVFEEFVKRQDEGDENAENDADTDGNNDDDDDDDDDDEDDDDDDVDDDDDHGHDDEDGNDNDEDDDDDEDEGEEETVVNHDENVVLGGSVLNSDSERKKNKLCENTRGDLTVKLLESENQLGKTVTEKKKSENGKSRMVMIPNDIDINSLIEEVPLKIPQSVPYIMNELEPDKAGSVTMLHSNSKESNRKKSIESNNLKLREMDNKKTPDPDSTTPESHAVETEIEVIDEEIQHKISQGLDSGEKPQPILKLRSFAKTPEFWNNSQEPKNVQIGINTKDSMNTDDPIEVVDLEFSNEKVLVKEPSSKNSICIGLKTAADGVSSLTDSGRAVPLSSATISKKLQPNPLAARSIIQANTNKFTRVVRVSGKRPNLLITLPSGSTPLIRQSPVSVPRRFIHQPSSTLAVTGCSRNAPPVRTLSQKVLDRNATAHHRIAIQADSQIVKKVNIVRISKPNNGTELVNTNHKHLIIRKQAETVVNPHRVYDSTVSRQSDVWKPSSCRPPNK